MGTTYEFSRFEYVLTVFVDHTSSKCDRIAVKDEYFWEKWDFLKAGENVFLDSGGRGNIALCL